MENAEKLNGDPEQIAVGGESAGGNLAAVVCQALLAGGLGLPVHQLLIYPVTDLTFDKPSFREHAHAQPLSAAMMPWFAHHYLASESDIPNPRVSPLRAPDLSGLPPATIITAEHDPLRDDGRAYAKRLQDAGVKVNYRNYPGLMHEFFGLAGMIDAAREAVNEAARDLNESFGRARTPALL
jgi:acetyl esterase